MSKMGAGMSKDKPCVKQVSKDGYANVVRDDDDDDLTPLMPAFAYRHRDQTKTDAKHERKLKTSSGDKVTNKKMCLNKAKETVNREPTRLKQKLPDLVEYLQEPEEPVPVFRRSQAPTSADLKKRRQREKLDDSKILLLEDLDVADYSSPGPKTNEEQPTPNIAVISEHHYRPARDICQELCNRSTTRLHLLERPGDCHERRPNLDSHSVSVEAENSSFIDSKSTKYKNTNTCEGKFDFSHTRSEPKFNYIADESVNTSRTIIPPTTYLGPPTCGKLGISESRLMEQLRQQGLIAETENYAKSSKAILGELKQVGFLKEKPGGTGYTLQFDEFEFNQLNTRPTRLSRLQNDSKYTSPPRPSITARSLREENRDSRITSPARLPITARSLSGANIDIVSNTPRTSLSGPNVQTGVDVRNICDYNRMQRKPKREHREPDGNPVTGKATRDRIKLKIANVELL